MCITLLFFGGVLWPLLLQSSTVGNVCICGVWCCRPICAHLDMPDVFLAFVMLATRLATWFGWGVFGGGAALSCSADVLWCFSELIFVKYSEILKHTGSIQVSLLMSAWTILHDYVRSNSEWVKAALVCCIWWIGFACNKAKFDPSSLKDWDSNLTLLKRSLSPSVLMT